MFARSLASGSEDCNRGDEFVHRATRSPPVDLLRFESHSLGLNAAFFGLAAALVRAA